MLSGEVELKNNHYYYYHKKVFIIPLFAIKLFIDNL